MKPAFPFVEGCSFRFEGNARLSIKIVGAV
jgi:hypothetical protein